MSGPYENCYDIFEVSEGKNVLVVSESGNWSNIRVKSEKENLTDG